MPKAKVAVTLDTVTLRRVDQLVRDARYPNRSHEHRRLIDECAKLDPAEERAMAEEGFAVDVAEWPEY